MASFPGMGGGLRPEDVVHQTLSEHDDVWSAADAYAAAAQGHGVMGGYGYDHGKDDMDPGAYGYDDMPPSPMSGRGGGSAGGQQRRFKSPERMNDPSKNFKVVIRVRPPLPRELEADKPFQNVVAVTKDERQIAISENLSATEDGADPRAGPYTAHRFTFDHVYDVHSNQKKVYETTAKSVVDSALQGYNATIFAYGQTGTGKTFTMEGFNSAEARGIIPRAIEQIFKHIQTSVSHQMRFLVRASYLQIYNEVISDLLKPERTNLVIREDKKKGVFVEGLSEWVVRSPQEIYGLI